MLSNPIRDLTLATLLTLGCGCVIVPGAPNPARTPHPATAHAPKKKPAARPKQVAHAGKPAKPRPAQHPVDETGGGKPAKPGTRPGGGKPDTRPKPGPDERPTEPEAPPSPDATHMVVPVRVDFAETVARIDEQIVRTAKQDWQTVSAPGDLTRVEVRYKVWRDPIAADFDDQTLKVGVKVRYAADVRVSTKNPFGGRIWITRGESWGTRSEPQQIGAKFHATFNIKDDFSVKAGVELDDIDHGQAPSGEVCVQAGVKLCVSKAAIAPMVRKNLERYLVPRIEKALDDADKQLERSLSLKRTRRAVGRAAAAAAPAEALAGRVPEVTPARRARRPPGWSRSRRRSASRSRARTARTCASTSRSRGSSRCSSATSRGRSRSRCRR
jgi:hypothetical protein